MELSVRHANPRRGNESYVLRFDDGPSHQHTPCLLVDAGANVDINSLLADDEYLVGIILTHAHTDHYATLADNLQDGANIYAAPDTATILDTVLSDNPNFSPSETKAVTDALVAVEDWTTIINGVRIRPIPAGHAPGAAGFLLQFEDGDDWQTMLATGDFSLNDVGGYPGFSTDLPVDIGALFLTGATAPDHTGTMTDALNDAVELASAGSRVLLTTTGLSAVTAAYRLGHLAEELDATFSASIMGQAAKLYTDLGYHNDVPNVRPIPDFDNPDPYFRDGMITIAGPQTPREGASKRIFGCIRDDPAAALIQLTDGSANPVSDASCTIATYDHRAHPTEADVDAIVEAFDPVEVFITHQTRGGVERYRDKYQSYVWATDDSDWYRLYENTQWLAPPWMTQSGKSYVETNRLDPLTDGGATFGEIPTPTRTTSVDLEAEGLDLDAFSVTTDTAVSTQTKYTATGEPQSDQLAVAADSGAQTTETTKTSDTAEPSTTTSAETADEPVTDTGTTTAQARIVDAGDGVKFLRFVGDTPDAIADAAHGEEVTVRLDD